MDALRALLSNSDGGVSRSATGTRAGPGKPFRWSGGWVSAIRGALGWANPERCKAATRERAALVETILHYGRLHGDKV